LEKAVENATATRTEVLRLLKVPPAAEADAAAINSAIDTLIKDRDANDPKGQVSKDIAQKLRISEKASAKEFQDALSRMVGDATAARTQVLQLLKVPPSTPEAELAAINKTIEDLIKERDEHRALLKRMKIPEGASLFEVTNTSPLDTMMMVMWMGIGAGLVLASPIIMYEIWGFVSPGLRQKEKNAIVPILFGGIFFFIGGCAIAYEWLFPFSLNFFVWLDLNLGIRPLYSVDKYSTLLFNMLWMTGLVCEIPLVIAGLAKLGLVKASTLTNYWRICILISFILGSLFSPGSDIMSMLVFSALLLSLYLLSIIMAWIFFPKEVLEQERKIEAERKREEEEERRKQQ
jgi:sec-independent protein translocase protein TatC